jgi:short-subunit dehydrogenase
MGIIGAKSMTDYCASKFGLVGFSESLRQDLSDT